METLSFKDMELISKVKVESHELVTSVSWILITLQELWPVYNEPLNFHIIAAITASFESSPS